MQLLIDTQVIVCDLLAISRAHTRTRTHTVDKDR